MTEINALKREQVNTITCHNGNVFINGKISNFMDQGFYLVDFLSEDFESLPLYKRSTHPIGKYLSMEHLSLGEIAKLVGVSRQRVSQVNKALGIRPPHTKVQKNDIVEYAKQHGVEAAVAMFGIDAEYFQHRPERIHIEIRKRELFINGILTNYLKKASYFKVK